jgi:hypothetical protein
VLSLDISVLEDRAAWLQNRLTSDNWEVSAMVQRAPDLLRYNTEDNLIPTLDYLPERLAMDDATVFKTVQKCPSILGLSIHDGFEPNWTIHR